MDSKSQRQAIITTTTTTSCSSNLQGLIYKGTKPPRQITRLSESIDIFCSDNKLI